MCGSACTDRTSDTMKISVHELSKNPDAAYKQICQREKFIKLKVDSPNKPCPTNKARVVCMSDTHSLTSHIKFEIPDGDIFIHAGDFTKCGLRSEVRDFNRWLSTLPHKYKIVVAGNHELSFDTTFTHPFEKNVNKAEIVPCLGMARSKICEAVQSSTEGVRSELTACTYLEDSTCEILGLKIYGTPWQPEFCNWAFNLPRGGPCLDKWDGIPSDTDILITHSPPLGHGDLTCTGVRAGCVDLLQTVQQRVHPRYHVFGHIHEGYGVSTDGKVIYVNASTCDISYTPSNKPIVFDIALPDGHTK